MICNKNRWIVSALSLLLMPIFSATSMAECGSDNTMANIAETHVQERLEGKIRVNTRVAADVMQVSNVSGCRDGNAEELILTATQPGSDAPPKFFRMLDGVPAYYLNKDYAYTIRMDNAAAYTAKGTAMKASKRNGVIAVPRASVSVYAAVDNPEPLRLSSAQIGVVKNGQQETVARLNLSANIDTVETCMIETPRSVMDFRTIEMAKLDNKVGKTEVSVDTTISVSCTDENHAKNVFIILNSGNHYANAGESVIASDNPSIGFVLYHDTEQITNKKALPLGKMTSRLHPQLRAYIYKLKQNTEPGHFSGSAEYTIEFR